MKIAVVPVISLTAAGAVLIERNIGTMNNALIKSAGLVLLPAAMLSFSSCAKPPQGTVEITAAATPEGAIIVETTTMTATVTAINAAKRKVTLVFEGGDKSTYKAGPEVVNFDQIQVGDQIKAVVTEEAAIFISSDAPPSAMTETTVVLAPVGAKPGSVIVDTAQVTVKIIDVDAAKKKITFELSDGTTKTVKVGKNTDLSIVRPGDNVTVLVSEGLAITVEKNDTAVTNDSSNM
jgi:hypothetical protein